MSSHADAGITSRILVVDDASIFRRAVSDVLSGIAGVTIVGTASNGRMALSQISALQPDLITLDIEVPEMNGIEVLEAMCKGGQTANVIVLSSRTVRGGEMTIRALEAGAFLLPGKFDVVFCRNVAIYFNERDRASLFTRIGQRLENDGSLVIGAMESLSGLYPQFESKRHLRSVFYQLKNSTLVPETRPLRG